MPRAATIRHRAGLALASAAGIAAAWAAVVAMSGGISIHTGVSRLGSRDPVRPLIVAGLLTVIAWRLLGTNEARRVLRRALGDRRTAPARIAALAAACSMIVATAWNTRAAGGSDSSCYVLQAEAFARGHATLDPPIARPPAVVPSLAMAPIGFVPSNMPERAAPICAPGLALAMVPAVLISRDAVFLVVPLFAALAVWCTFLLGRGLELEAAGACGAVLLACSPIFLYQAVQPMSDVPAAALWLAALVALRPASNGRAAQGSRGRLVLAGVCASVAVLMRPNMALLVGPLLMLLPFGRSRFNGGSALSAWLWFGAASLPALGAMLALNASRYGSPFASGYGDTGALFSWAHVGPNLTRYPRWLLESHTPFIALALIAPWLPASAQGRRLMWAAAAAVVLTLGTYFAYTVFDDWWYIRFLLPAVPVLLVLSAIVVLRAAAWLLPRRGPAAATAIAAAVTAALGVWFVHVARARATFDLQELEARFRLAGEYAGRALTEDAIVLAVQQSGSVRYYGRRATLAWDGLGVNALDAAVAQLAASGRTVFIVVEDAEEAAFRARFAGERYGALDWRPFAEVHGPTRVRFFDPRQRARYLAGERYNVELVGRVRTR